MGGKQRWAVLHDNDNEVIGADSARTSQQCYRMKRPACAACPVFPRMLRPLLLLSVSWGCRGQVNSVAGRVPCQPKAEQQLDSVDQNDGISDIVKKMLANKKARAKSSRHVQSISGCNALNARSWSRPTVNSWEGTSGYAKPSTDDSPAADSDILTTAGQMWDIMFPWITLTMRNC